MGRKGSWFSSVKKAFSPDSKKDQKSNKSKKSVHEKEIHKGSEASSLETVAVPPRVPQPEAVQLTDAGNDQSIHTELPAVADVLQAAVSSTEVAKEPVPVIKIAQLSGKTKEDVAAVKIQTAFRGYLARRALRALRGLVRLKSLMEGAAIKRQASQTLRCMQTLSRVQTHISSRRIRIAEENQALQKQLLQKHAQELEKLQIEEEWDDSLQSKEQIKAKLLSKYEAAMRRERALAYAFTHQKTRKNPARSVNLTFMDPNNPTWGWSWLERWMAASKGMIEKELNNDSSSVKSSSRSNFNIGGEISKAYARYQINSGKLSSAGSPKFSEASNKKPPEASDMNTTVRKIKSASPKGRAADDDIKSTVSMKSHRRHSIAGALMRDDESLASSQTVPSYMVPTESARARLKPQSPLGLEKNGTEKGPAGGNAKKRLSFPSSPAKLRRHSGPPKVHSSINTENGASNGGDS